QTAFLCDLAALEPTASYVVATSGESKRPGSRQRRLSIRLALQSDRSDLRFPNQSVDPFDGETMKIRERLRALSDLESDWDSYGGEPPSQETVSRARSFIAFLLNLRPHLNERIVPTSLSPLATGGIDIEWRRPGQLISVEVDPGGTWGFLY